MMIPNVDLQDISNEYPNNQPSKKGEKVTHPIHCVHPEFTQQCYIRIRQMEESYQISNYFKKEKKMKKKDTIADKFK